MVHVEGECRYQRALFAPIRTKLVGPNIRSGN